MKQKFTYYMHSSHCSEGMREFLTEETDLQLSDAAIEKIISDRPFYEIGIECEVDEHGNVTILGVEQ